jgi:hypothetical protein
VLQVFGQMPGQGVAASDAAASVAGDDDRHTGQGGCAHG